MISVLTTVSIVTISISAAMTITALPLFCEGRSSLSSKPPPGETTALCAGGGLDSGTGA